MAPPPVTPVGGGYLVGVITAAPTNVKSGRAIVLPRLESSSTRKQSPTVIVTRRSTRDLLGSRQPKVLPLPPKRKPWPIPRTIVSFRPTRIITITPQPMLHQVVKFTAITRFIPQVQVIARQQRVFLTPQQPVVLRPVSKHIIPPPPGPGGRFIGLLSTYRPSVRQGRTAILPIGGPNPTPSTGKPAPQIIRPARRRLDIPTGALGFFVKLYPFSNTPVPGPVRPIVPFVVPAANVDFTTYGGAVVVSAIGQETRAYLVRNDINQISILDTRTPSVTPFAVQQWHTFTSEEKHRGSRLKVVRIRVSGTGQILPNSNSFMSVTVDKARSDVYLWSPQSGSDTNGLLWQQNTLALTGYAFDVSLYLIGTNIEVSQVKLEYVLVT